MTVLFLALRWSIGEAMGSEIGFDQRGKLERVGRVAFERWAAGELVVDEPSDQVHVRRQVRPAVDIATVRVVVCAILNLQIKIAATLKPLGPEKVPLPEGADALGVCIAKPCNSSESHSVGSGATRAPVSVAAKRVQMRNCPGDQGGCVQVMTGAADAGDIGEQSRHRRLDVNRWIPRARTDRARGV